MMARVPGSPSISRRELLAVSACAVILALLMHRSLVAELGTAVPKDLGDPLAQAWQVAWGGHALLEQPSHLFDANQFWPGRNTLAYSDALLGYAPFGMLGSGPHAAIVRYDVLFLLAAALCLAAAYLLARELGLTPGPALVAAIAFAYAPYRLEQYNHLHVLSSGGIPLAVFLLVRGHRRGGAGMVVAGWLVTTWQLTLGFSLGLLLIYLVGTIGLTAAVLWWRRGRPRPDARLLGAHVAGIVVLGIVAVLISRPYLAVLDELPEAQRTLRDVATFSGGVASYLSAAEESTLWGSLTAPARAHLSFASEQTLFPGATVVALALAGLLWAGGPFHRPLRVLLAIGVAVCAVLALGTATAGPKAYSPYRALYELAPGFQAIRVPGRITTLTTLGLALLAGAGAQRAAGALLRRRGRRVALAAVTALALLVLFEGSALRTGDDDATAFRTPEVPPSPAGFAAIAGPVLHLPAEPQDNRRYLLWSTEGFEPMVNGRSSVTPRRFERVLRDAAPFPDARSVDRLRAFGVRSVVLHRGNLDGTSWERWARRSLRGLGVRRSVGDELVVYDLRGTR